MGKERRRERDSQTYRQKSEKLDAERGIDKESENAECVEIYNDLIKLL